VQGQVFYLITEAFRGWKQHRTVILPSLVTIFLCSVLLAASLSFLMGSLRAISHRDAFYKVEAFFVSQPDSAEILTLQQRILAIKEVDSVTYVDPEAAKAEFSSIFPPEMLEQLEGNPLPGSFRIVLQSRYQNPMDLRRTMHEMERWQVFDVVQAPVVWSEWIERWRFDMVFWPTAISVLLLLTLGLIIGNAVRLTLYSRRLLVENMKYAGGSVFFIQFPFVLEGWMQGFLGSLGAAVLWGGILWSLKKNIPALDPYLVGMGFVLFAIVVVVSCLGAWASYRSVRSFLQKSW